MPNSLQLVTNFVFAVGLRRWQTPDVMNWCGRAALGGPWCLLPPAGRLGVRGLAA